MRYEELLGYYCEHCKRMILPYELESVGTSDNKEWIHKECRKKQVIRKPKEPIINTTEDLFID